MWQDYGKSRKNSIKQWLCGRAVVSILGKIGARFAPPKRALAPPSPMRGGLAKSSPSRIAWRSYTFGSVPSAPCIHVLGEEVVVEFRRTKLRIGSALTPVRTGEYGTLHRTNLKAFRGRHDIARYGSAGQMN